MVFIMDLIISGLEKSFDKTPVLRNASYTFEKGKIYGLLGRNGAGKTTMFNCLAQNIKSDGGQILLRGDGGEVHPATFEDVGFVFTQPRLPEFMTGWEFIKYFIDINRERFPSQVNMAAAFDVIDFDNADRHRLIRDYSHGMQNKLQILAFLLLRPPVILLDEPLTSFDVVVALQIKKLIQSIKHDHIIILSTHILQLAQDLCDEIVILHGGTLSGVCSDDLHSPGFEQKIIELLGDESGDGSHA